MTSPRRLATTIVVALWIAACATGPQPSEPVVPVVPSTPHRPEPVPAPPVVVELDDAVVAAVDPSQRMGGALSDAVQAQRAPLERWLASDVRHTDTRVLVARLRVAGLLGLGPTERYTRHLLDGDPQVVAAARLAARRASGLHKPSFRRLGVLGASVSAGFLGRSVATWLDDALEDAEVLDASTTFLFRMDPDERQVRIDDVRDFAPEVTFAFDELFWWTHGRYRRRLDEGLRQLEGVPGLLLVGTVPRMVDAKSYMLGRVPSREHIEAANRRIAEWAAPRASVVVVPLHVWYRELRAGTASPAAGDPPVSADDLFAPDGLHLSARGTQLVLRRTAALLRRELPDLDPGAFSIPWP
jgi:hypothetical protein